MLKENPLFDIRDRERKKVPKSADKLKLWRLDAYKDEAGVLRIGSRLNRPTLGICKKPGLLPRGILCRRICEYYHQKVAHCGRTTTAAEIRSAGYWILGANRMIEEIIFKCTTGCRRLHRKLGEQKMDNLPEDRLQAEGPFSFGGLDIFGPYYVTQLRRKLKRYIALFTCMSSRAVHMEVTDEMTADSLINSLRRVICWRGPVRYIRTDNGSNFIGAGHELARSFMEMDKAKIEEFLFFGSRTGNRSSAAAVKAENVMNSSQLNGEDQGDPAADLLTPNHILAENGVTATASRQVQRS